MNITNFSGVINLSINSSSFGPSVCVLDQQAMLNQLEKLPVLLFVFLSIAVVALLLHIYIVPRLSEKQRGYVQDGMVTFGLASLVWAWLLALPLTFQLNAFFWEVSEMVVIGFLVVLVVVKVWPLRGGLRK